ncbi:MAG: histidine kinase [Caldilineaceae bacterium]
MPIHSRESTDYFRQRPQREDGDSCPLTTAVLRATPRVLARTGDCPLAHPGGRHGPTSARPRTGSRDQSDRIAQLGRSRRGRRTQPPGWDLHDSVTQALYSQTLTTPSAVRQLARGNADQAAAHLRQLQEAAQQALRGCGCSSSELRRLRWKGPAWSPRSRRGWMRWRALRAWSPSWARRQPLPPSGCDGDRPLLDCPEALSSAFRRTKMTRIELTLTDEPDRVVLTIADNGVGVDPTTSAAAAHNQAPWACIPCRNGPPTWAATSPSPAPAGCHHHVEAPNE